eukprot:NODE_2951_length_722_cov_196.034175_g2082_i0.p1 GENE.NODE_2951_length_722_cov_196.034175_g2082_i0~~NODE_2951_length_722_cov_196.034175_g2082_i0.p1  ORF type:complete len:145 (-),score=59.77 NODE_2951_length_722_cov_196.034175_g2082_i0:286-693(-)
MGAKMDQNVDAMFLCLTTMVLEQTERSAARVRRECGLIQRESTLVPEQAPFAEETLRLRFDRLDEDGSGFIDRREFEAINAEWGELGLTAAEIADIHGRHSKYTVRTAGQKEGAEGAVKITFEEFVILMMQIAKR